MKIRLDDWLLHNDLAQDLPHARSLVMEGRVFMGQDRLTLPSLMVEQAAPIYLKDQLAYVSRGGLKLEKAIREYGLQLQGKICMDVGSSTGGFTDCMLQNGASRVFSIDVGYGLLDWKLRNDPRVTVMERTNARKLTADSLGGAAADFMSMDVSFISIEKVLPAVMTCLKPDAEAAILVKPQFEAPREDVGKGGIVRERRVHQAVLERALSFMPGIGLCVKGLTVSPVKGADGNTEFLLYAVKQDPQTRISPDITSILDSVWE